ncbi:hypothetical protein C5167_039897 [Papaver somniferum]|uniref:Uncharacterized protein n=1 Tax=Papaver somniferum TaxID=3469 RepID=A0A4Y7IHN7_PAPSO|nr:hypothetical protein C5167_039897 [Papaver somniferum]
MWSASSSIWLTIYGDHQPRRRTSSTSNHNIVVRGLTHHPRLMINTNFLSSSSSSTSKRAIHIRKAIENLPAGAPLPTLLDLLLLDGKVDVVVGKVDDAAKLIEDIGKEAVKLTDDFENKVPDGSVLKNTMCAIHDVVQGTVKVAILAEDLIHKGEALKKKMEDLIEKQEKAEDDQAEEHI